MPAFILRFLYDSSPRMINLKALSVSFFVLIGFGSANVVWTNSTASTCPRSRMSDSKHALSIRLYSYLEGWASPHCANLRGQIIECSKSEK